VTKERVAGGALSAQPPRMRRVWYWRQASLYAFLAPSLILLVLLTVGGVYIFGGPAQLGLILGGVELLAAVALAAALSPAIMLRPDLVRIWHGFKFVNIGTSEVAGIGMLCTRDSGLRPIIGWHLYIWRADGTGERTGYAYMPGLRRLRMPSNYDPVAASEIPGLTAGRAAAVGRDLDRRLLDIQGPEGPLATRRLEQHSRAVRLGPYDRVIAYWSPDGRTGHR
jgi:hypothetical protein